MTYKNKIFGDSIVNQLIQHFNLPLTNESSNIFSFDGEKIKVKQIDTNQIVISTLKTEYKIEKTLLNPIFSGDPKACQGYKCRMERSIFRINTWLQNDEELFRIDDWGFNIPK